MKTTLNVICITLFFLFITTTQTWADEFQETKKMFADAGVSDMFKKSYGYALFPTIGKAGFFIGGAFGDGRVYEKNNYIGDTTMSQATVGLQLGGSGFSQVVFFQDKRALDEFTNGNFEFGAEIQAVALTASAKASTNTSGSSATASGTMNHANTTGSKYHKGMATFTITKGGLMYEATLGGQNFSFKRR